MHAVVVLKSATPGVNVQSDERRISVGHSPRCLTAPLAALSSSLSACGRRSLRATWARWCTRTPPSPGCPTSTVRRRCLCLCFLAQLTCLVVGDCSVHAGQHCPRHRREPVGCPRCRRRARVAAHPPRRAAGPAGPRLPRVNQQSTCLPAAHASRSRGYIFIQQERSFVLQLDQLSSFLVFLP